MKRITPFALCLALTALGFGLIGPDADARSRKERPLPPIADPGKVAATDIAFSRAARDNGQWTAFREYATSDAVMHLAEGPVDASSWLAQRPDPSEPMRWGPKSIWTSCDGTIAVSFGRFLTPAGKVGSYATLWDVQDDNSYRWSYDIGALDSPQPPPPRAKEDDENAIIVSGVALIEGKAADCLRDKPLPTVSEQASELAEWPRNGTSKDGTLRWAYRQYEGGDRRLAVYYLRDGSWQEAIDFRIPATGS